MPQRSILEKDMWWCRSRRVFRIHSLNLLFCWQELWIHINRNFSMTIPQTMTPKTAADACSWMDKSFCLEDKCIWNLRFTISIVKRCKLVLEELVSIFWRTALMEELPYKNSALQWIEELFWNRTIQKRRRSHWRKCVAYTSHKIKIVLRIFSREVSFYSSAQCFQIA